MPIIRAQIILPMFTGTPTDVITNQLHISFSGSATGGVPQAHEHLKTALLNVYGSAAGARVNYVDWPLAHVKYFNLDDPTPRIPTILNLGYSGAGTAVSVIPTEVATVLSFHTTPASGVAFQRLYNRIFLGALLSTAMQASAADAYPTFAPAWITSVKNMAISLADNLDNVDGDGLWVQVSNATGTLLPGPVVGGWVDNSPDTQRRRSVLASSRNPWVPTP